MDEEQREEAEAEVEEETGGAEVCGRADLSHCFAIPQRSSPSGHTYIHPSSPVTRHPSPFLIHPQVPQSRTSSPLCLTPSPHYTAMLDSDALNLTLL